jgi:Na+/H+ antiporter NhaD/arsenite permease-like protein
MINDVVCLAFAPLLLAITETLGGDPKPYLLTLAMASTLSGNLTLPGSLATIIVVERAKKHTSISFMDFLKVGAPSAIVGATFGALWLGR